MRPDPKRVADTKVWLAKAATDLRSADVARTAEPPVWSDIVFHCQQAVEKALKGLLAWHDQPFRKTHNLIELGEQCARLHPTLEPLLRRAATLTEYATEYRYPGKADEPSPEEADEALSLAGEAYEAIVALLPDEVGP